MVYLAIELVCIGFVLPPFDNIAFIGGKELYEDDFCNCTETANKGAWCANWDGSGDLYCTLNGGQSAKHCPGAMIHKNRIDYWTMDHKVCSKSKGEENQFHAV